ANGTAGPTLGGGMHVAGGGSVRNTIVAQNTGSASAPDFSGAAGSQGFNLIGNTDGSSGWIGSDITGSTAAPLNALLGPLQDNGGPTLTMAPQAGSAAIDDGISA